MVVVDLRGQDRESGTIKGTVSAPALEFMKDIPRWCERFQNKPMVVFFCQYSAHRAPSVANYYRQSCPAKQRVLIIEGGFRAWEAQKLPVEAGKSSLPAAALDNLALKIGAELVAAVPQTGITQRVGWSQTSFAPKMPGKKDVNKQVEERKRAGPMIIWYSSRIAVYNFKICLCFFLTMFQ